MNASLRALGWTPELADHVDAGLVPARVATQHRGQYVILAEAGEVRAEAAGRLVHAGEMPAVGDWVAASLRPGEDRGTIHAVLPRRTQIVRKAAGLAAEEQVLAANIDTVFVATSLNRELDLRRLERYLIIAWESGAQPVVVLTKADLCADAAERTIEVEAVALGVPVLTLSAVTGDGFDVLAEHIVPGRTAVILGSSGVGKSTIVNRLAGEELLATQEIRGDDDEGRHTTRRRQLVLLPGGGLVIDTPGMRELGLWEDGGAVDDAFADVDELAADCRFHDCAHVHEPGCEVLVAVDDGRLPLDRLRSYRKLVRELAALEIRRDKRAQADRRREIRRLARARRQ